MRPGCCGTTHVALDGERTQGSRPTAGQTDVAYAASHASVHQRSSFRRKTGPCPSRIGQSDRPHHNDRSQTSRCQDLWRPATNRLHMTPILDHTIYHPTRYQPPRSQMAQSDWRPDSPYKEHFVDFHKHLKHIQKRFCCYGRPVSGRRSLTISLPLLHYTKTRRAVATPSLVRFDHSIYDGAPSRGNRF